VLVSGGKDKEKAELTVNRDENKTCPLQGHVTA
jgi:hypothetical protein